MKHLLIIFLCLPLLIGCSNTGDDSASQPTNSSDSLLLPDTDLTGATIYLYSGSAKKTKVDAAQIIKFEKLDSTVAFDLFIQIFDSVGNVTTNVVGDSGIIRESRDLLSIYGNVVVNGSDSMILETDRLFWNSKTEKINTDAYVKITKGSDVMTGYGLEADQALKSFKILRQPSGTIQDASKLKIE